VNFIEDTERREYDSETLYQQYLAIQRLTHKSHVLQWGDLSFQSDTIGQYLSGPKRYSNQLRLIRPI